MFMFCGDIQNAVPVCTRVRKDEDANDLLNKSVNSPEISDPTLMTQQSDFFLVGSKTQTRTQYSSQRRIYTATIGHIADGEHRSAIVFFILEVV